MTIQLKYKKGNFEKLESSAAVRAFLTRNYQLPASNSDNATGQENVTENL